MNVPVNAPVNPTTSTASLASGARLTRRNLIAAVAVTPMVGILLAACGDRSKGSGTDGTAPGTTAPGTTTPGTDGPTTTTATPSTTPATTPATTAGSDALPYSTDPEAVVVRVGYEGGFVPQSFAFVNLPTLLVAGDGRLLTPAPTTLQYPGPLVAPVNVQSITPAGIQAALQLAQTSGLLGPIPDYSSDASMNIADAPDTVVQLTVDGTTYVHSAYALGMGGATGSEREETPARQALLDFVRGVQALGTAVAPGEVGEAAPFEPAEYRFMATPFSDEGGDDASDDAEAAPVDTAAPDHAVVDWPAAAGVSLAETLSCGRAPAAALADVVADATVETVFRDAGQLYYVAIAAVLPGDTTCAPAP